METFYEQVRRREGWLMDGAAPVGGRFSHDADNRQPPPKGATTLGLPEPWWPTEDEVDDEVRHDLDRWERDGARAVRRTGRPPPLRRHGGRGRGGARRLPRGAARRLRTVRGRRADQRLDDGALAAERADEPRRARPPDRGHGGGVRVRGRAAPLGSVEGFVRQVAGWRDYVWHLYWWFGEEYGASAAPLGARAPAPAAPLVAGARRVRGRGRLPVHRTSTASGTTAGRTTSSG